MSCCAVVNRRASDSKGRDDMKVETILGFHRPATNGRRAARLRYLFPIAAFVTLVAVFDWALNHDPRTIPSALIDKPVPQFSLPPVQGRTVGLSNLDLVGE